MATGESHPTHSSHLYLDILTTVSTIRGYPALCQLPTTELVGFLPQWGFDPERSYRRGMTAIH